MHWCVGNLIAILVVLAPAAGAPEKSYNQTKERLVRSSSSQAGKERLPADIARVAANLCATYRQLNADMTPVRDLR